MLEIVNLKKTYKTKQGVQTNALNGISLKFPETGLIFLLGKSGSGKSTLLNVIGGLDTPTSGEVIIKGRSSKDFTQSDFDSYRNTFIGFIFQEYNILNEFSVENNIALALELQGKDKDEEKINELLKQVDLEGFGKRKPNTLSGGQKQRIAIARALIKNPEIIMADEPTGALDSYTGKQVFDTLKKLSKDKLVIVVSHDREFALTYADRIIELKDGKVIEDISKTYEEQEKVNENLSTVGDGVLIVKDGSLLKEDDFNYIKNFLKHNKNAIICSEEDDIKTIKKVTKINDEGSKEVFEDTKETLMKQYSKQDSKFIKSKLPFKHAFKIGISGLKNKPFRLFMTICLCTFAFAMFGLLSTMMLYDGNEVFKESMMSSDYSYIQASKQYTVTEKHYEGGVLSSSYDTSYLAKMNENEFNELKATFGNDTFGSVSYITEIENISKRNSYSYYNSNILAVGYIDESNSLYNSMIGNYPKNKNEIAISKYLAESIKEFGLNKPDKDQKYTLNNIEDLIDKTVVLSGKKYKITGIIDTGNLPSKFDSLKDSKEMDLKLQYELEEELSQGLYSLIFTTKDNLNNFKSYDTMWKAFDGVGYTSVAFKNYNASFSYGKYSSNKNEFDITYLGSDKKLDDGEIIISSSLLYNIINNKVNDTYLIDSWHTGLVPMHEKFNQYLYENTSDKYKDDVIKFINNNNMNNIEITLYDIYNNSSIENYKQKYKIIGFYRTDNMDTGLLTDNDYDKINKEAIKYYNETGQYYTLYETDYKAGENLLYDRVYLSYDKSLEKSESLVPYLNEKQLDDNTTISLNNGLVNQILEVNYMANSFKKVFLYVGIAMAFFAALLLSNFISASISHKTKEIGILRAVGARGSDVFKIFLSESFMITLICVILSTIGGNVICTIFNNSVSEMLGMKIFVFGIVSIIILVVIALVTTIISTFIPVYKAAHKKPVDSIRSL